MKYITLHVGDTSYDHIPFFPKGTPEQDIPYARNFLSSIISPTGDNLGQIFSIPNSFTWDDDATNTGVYYDSPEGRRLLVNTDRFYTVATLVRGKANVYCASSNTSLSAAGIRNKVFPRSVREINENVGFYAVVKVYTLINDDKRLNIFEDSVISYGVSQYGFFTDTVNLTGKGKNNIYIGHTGRIYEKDGRRFVEEISYTAYRGTELVYTQDWATSFPQKVFSFIENDGITSMTINARAKEVTE